MVTTRSQDKMTFADSIRAKGFSLADCKFLKLNASLAHGPLRRGPCGNQIYARRVGPRIDSTQATIMVATCALYPETIQPLFA